MNHLSSLSIYNLIAQADIVVQMVMLSLAIASLVSWAVIFDKIIKFILLRNKSNKFEEEFDGGEMLEQIYQKNKKNDNHPLSHIFVCCIKEWKESNVKRIIGSADKKSSLKERLISIMEVATNRSMQKMESGLNLLAIIGSAAPFVGLFGTVWGIMNSFQGIAISKNTSLAVVAPGIAEALLATAMGLFAAIPAVFFFNIFTNKINQFYIRAENFASQLLNLLSKELDR